MAADGSVVIEASMNTSKAEQDLAELKAKIEKLESSIKSDTDAKTGLEERARQMAVTLDTAKAKLYEMQTAAKGVYSKEDISEQKEYVKNLQAEWDGVMNAVDRYTRTIAASETQLEGMKIQAGQMEAEIDKANSPMGKLHSSMEEGSKSAKKLLERIKSLAMSALVFSVMTQGFNALKDWVGQTVRANDEARASFARLQGALLTLVQPLIEVIIPAFTAFVNILTVIVTRIAALLSALFGSTLEQSAAAAEGLYEETNALNGLGGAAKKAKGSLAGFDEINTINTQAAGGGGAGTASTDIMPDFTLDGGITDRLKEIADLVMLIAAGLALWKLGTLLPGVLGQIATILGGILLTVGGLLLAWHGLSDAWENGVNWGNLIESIAGVAAAALGLYLLFGKIGAGIGLIVGGIALLVTAFHDAMASGWNLQNTLMALSGILAAGLGISLLTGSWIPLLIAGIAAALLALTNATGHGEELLDGIRQVIQGFKDFFVGVFTGDLTKAIGGLEKIFEGLKTVIFAVINGVRDSINSFLTWLDDKTGGKLHGIIEFVRGLFNGLFDFVNSTLGGLLDAVEQILEGVVEFVSGVFTGDWDRAWQGVKDIFKGVWNGIIGFLEGAVNLIIQGINWLIRQMNKISVKVPDWVPGIGGKSYGVNIPSVSSVSIPRLAQGAVIPPNREFMAVLGDQKSGTNVEAPEDLIRKIVREESGNAEMLAVLRKILTATKARQRMYVGKRGERILAEIAVDGINERMRTSGTPVLDL